MRYPVRRPGFTILELLLVIGILAILGAIAIPRYTQSRVQVVTRPDSVLPPGITVPVAVRIADRDNDPARHERVQFSVDDGGGRVSAQEVTTDSTGRATVLWTLGPAPGHNQLTAGIGKSVRTAAKFEVRTVAGAPMPANATVPLPATAPVAAPATPAPATPAPTVAPSAAPQPAAPSPPGTSAPPAPAPRSDTTHR